MRITLDDFVDDEIKDFLLTQEGITNVELIDEEDSINIDINFNEKTTANIIKKYIDLYTGNKNSNMIGFDKNIKEKCNILNYKIEDMCCEYCYKGLVEELFENKYVKSVKSNYKFDIPKYNTEFIIEYLDTYDEETLINYIKDNSI